MLLDSNKYIIDRSTGKPELFDHDNDDETANVKQKGTLKDPVSDSLQHHYNDEAIAIVVTGGTLASLKKGSTELPLGDEVSDRRTSATEDTTTFYSLIKETKNRQLDSDEH